MNALDPKTPKSKSQLRKRNLAVMAALVAFALLIYAISIVKMRAGQL